MYERVNEDPDGSKNAGLWGGAGIRDNMSVKAQTGETKCKTKTGC